MFLLRVGLHAQHEAMHGQQLHHQPSVDLNKIHIFIFLDGIQ